MLGDNIRKIRKEKRISINNLARLSGISVGYLSDIENNKFTNPTLDKLNKIAEILEVSTTELFNDQIDSENVSQVNETQTQYEIELKTPEAAIQFILKQPSIMSFGGFDINKLSASEKNQFASEMLNHLQLLSLKYKK
ncbi:helix-turn-helix domain-containing protein [Clostridium saccharoperbutylacetonicum]